MQYIDIVNPNEEEQSNVDQDFLYEITTSANNEEFQNDFYQNFREFTQSETLDHQLADGKFLNKSK